MTAAGNAWGVKRDLALARPDWPSWRVIDRFGCAPLASGEGGCPPGASPSQELLCGGRGAQVAGQDGGPLGVRMELEG